ncbi:MAG: COR domain-containing protein [Caldilineaceae bacterium]
MARQNEAYLAAEKKIQEALQAGATELDLSNDWNAPNKKTLTELPESIGKLKQVESLDLSHNKLTTLPASLGHLTLLQSLDLSHNQLTTLPESLGQLTQLQSLDLSHNKLTTLPESLGKLKQLKLLNLSDNQLVVLPDSISQLKQLNLLSLLENKITSLPDGFSNLTKLKILSLSSNPLGSLPDQLGRLTALKHLGLSKIQLKFVPDWLSKFTKLEELGLASNELATLPESLRILKKIHRLSLGNYETIYTKSYAFGYGRPFDKGNELNTLPEWLSELTQLKSLDVRANKLLDLPASFAHLKHLETFLLGGNPLNPALQSAYDAGLDELKAYLRSLENAEPLYEAKLVLVGEGNVGKTTLLKALKGKKGEEAPKPGERTTHGVEIDIHGLLLPHPTQDGIEIQLNAWDFGGQDVYRVTHQFFFSRRSLYLVIWEPRRGVQAGQVEDWLNMIRLRVGEEARVLIVSTHCKTGERIARIDKPVLQQQYGDMIVGFYEVDSLVPDGQTGEMVGIAALKKVIAEQSARLKQMGMLFSPQWKAARDELIAHPEPRISYAAFSEICANHTLSPIATKTLAHLMHDLGYIVHYSDDERLRDDVVLQPQWLTKAIGFVLEDRATQDSEGILPDHHLQRVWQDHPFKDEPRYAPDLYPFFLRLMEKYDVSYRLPEERHASLVAQHVPQVRPELPWLPEGDPPTNLRRIAMICTLEEDPPGLVPWMIVRTHDYAVDHNSHRLHWQRGMFLRHPPHGEAMLEKRGREFHIYAQADWPEHFMNVLHSTLQKLITDNWPGLEGRYRFMVPCPEIIDGQPCKGRFNIHALRQFLTEGDTNTRCPECTKRQSIAELLFGFEERPVDVQLREIKEQLAGLDSRIANYFMAMMHAIADEAKHGPRLFTFRSREAGLSPKQLFSRPITLQLWCEAEGCQHPLFEKDKGNYEIEQPRKWVTEIAPYATFVLGLLKTVAPIAAPAINTFFGAKTTETWGITDHLDFANSILDQLPADIKSPDRPLTERGIVSEPERSGILALHRLLNEIDPTQDRLGLHRVATYTGDYRWLCQHHYDAWQPHIPDVIPSHES